VARAYELEALEDTGPTRREHLTCDGCHEYHEVKKMAFTATVETSHVVVDPGFYHAEFVRIEETTGPYGLSWRWFWKLFHAELGTVEMTMMSSPRLTPSTKAGEAYHVMNGGEFAKVGENVDLEQFYGVICEVQIENKIKDGVEYSNITKIVKLVDDTNSFIARERGSRAKSEEDHIPF